MLARSGEAGFVERVHHAEFAVDCMGGGEQLGSGARLGTQHVALVAGGELECRIRLPALELLNRQLAGKSLDVLAHVSL